MASNATASLARTPSIHARSRDSWDESGETRGDVLLVVNRRQGTPRWGGRSQCRRRAGPKGLRPPSPSPCPYLVSAVRLGLRLRVLTLRLTLRGLVRGLVGLLHVPVSRLLTRLRFLVVQPQAVQRLADALSARASREDLVSRDPFVAEIVPQHVGGDELTPRELRVRRFRLLISRLQRLWRCIQLRRDAAEALQMLCRLGAAGRSGCLHVRRGRLCVRRML